MLRYHIKSILTLASATLLIAPLASCATPNARQHLSPSAVLQIDTNADFEFAATDSFVDLSAYGRILSVTPNEEVAGEVIHAFESEGWDEDMTEDDGI